ncbi:CPBP family intramembrane glutamic endopeptidase [Deinococcus planocerae]|uniref:CPBP family intramembrane glutamic endopeptidase n=1 Tax=Deinococcus planocerae TaxID=1737569 RepID=UPI000C7F3F93|nr:type II CAAX endopeptidase family protein [Deinococcus planocerae]
MDRPLSIPSSRRPGRALATFFTLTFLISWGAWVPVNLAARGVIAAAPPAALANLVAVFGPLLAAVLTARVMNGGAGPLFSGLWRWRLSARWYAFVLLYPPALSLVTSGVSVLLGQGWPDWAHPPILQALPDVAAPLWPWPLLPLLFVQQTFLGSSMGEEVGWRAFALPRMQARWGALPASLLLGAVWGVWHWPYHSTPGHPLEHTPFGWTVLGTVAASVLFTWVWNGTRGSLLLALLFHSSVALTSSFVASGTGSGRSAALAWVAPLAVIAATRGSLGRRARIPSGAEESQRAGAGKA